jgi:GTP:adenosylcobinamide-phosphate guanylyltransferase
MPDALVLAGGKPDPALAQGVPNKAFLPLLGRPMVEFVLAALREASTIRRIALVGPLPLPSTVARYVHLPVGECGTLLDNVAAGLAALGGGGPVLAVGADIPLLTAHAVDAFVEAAASLDAEVVYGVVRREDVQKFSRARKTFVRLREGSFAGGSLILLDPGGFTRARGRIEQAIRARKRPWGLARLFGLPTMVGFLTGTLRIADLESRAAALTGVRARALISAAPEIGIDVDTPEMLALVCAHLSARSGAPVPQQTERLAGW